MCRICENRSKLVPVYVIKLAVLIYPVRLTLATSLIVSYWEFLPFIRTSMGSLIDERLSQQGFKSKEKVFEPKGKPQERGIKSGL